MKVCELSVSPRIRVLSKLLAPLLCFFLLHNLEAWAAQSSQVKPNQTGASPTPEASKRKRLIRKKGRRRHRRLKVSRSLKPMPPLSEAPFSAAVPVVELIEEGKSRLEKEVVSYFPGSRKQTSRREIKLALANFKTGEIQIVSGIETNQKFSLLGSDVRFRVDWWNGFNSSMTILEPANTGVVALLYALEPERQKFLRQDAIIYCPYSSALLQTELVEAGKNYLMEKIAQARKELAHVRSHAFAGMSLESAGWMSNEDYFNLILTEQMDPGRFRSIASGDTELSPEQVSEIMRLAERILVILGANQEDAYSFTGNYASARGLTQFTPVGMRVVWDQYPEAGISRDFLDATGEPVNAIKAEICLLDHDLADLSRTYPNLIGSGFAKYAAGASYNGGPRRVHYGLQHFGVDWLHPVVRFTNLSNKKRLSQNERLEYQWLKSNRGHETFVYLNKLHAIERTQEKLLLSKAPNNAGSEVSVTPPLQEGAAH